MTPMTTRRPYVAALVALIFLAAVCLIVAYPLVRYAEPEHEYTDDPAATSTAVLKPYATTVELPDGRTAVCVVNGAGGLACEFPDAPARIVEVPAP